MLKRNTPLRRKTRIKTSPSPSKARADVRRINPERAAERRRYDAARRRYLAEHPFDQIWIAQRRLDEAAVIAARGWWTDELGTKRCVPRSTQIHHRNKARGARLLDERWWMATSTFSHEQVERNKGWAREKGYLLPIQADAEGRWGAGNQALTTAELLARRA